MIALKKKYGTYVKRGIQAAIIAAACFGISGCSVIEMLDNPDERYFKKKDGYQPSEHTVIVACQISELFEGVPFQLTYDLLKNYPDSFRDEVQSEWCQTGIRPLVTIPDTNTLRYYQDTHRRTSITVNNQDSARGATKSWALAGVQVDAGENPSIRLDSRFSFRADIIDGEKFPLGSSFSILHDWIDYRPELTETEYLESNGLKWTRRVWHTIGAGKRVPLGFIRSRLEVYQAKVGDYSILVYATFPRPVLNDPDWLSDRRAILRQWVYSFSAGPVTKPGLPRIPAAQRASNGR